MAATFFGAAISTTTMANTTFSGNRTHGGGVFRARHTITRMNTIVVGNSDHSPSGNLSPRDTPHDTISVFHAFNAVFNEDQERNLLS